MAKKPTKVIKPTKAIKPAKPVKPVKPKALKVKPPAAKVLKAKVVKAQAVKTQAGPAPRVEGAGASGQVLDRLYTVVQTRRSADPAVSHSARLLSRGTAKVAQKFGEEAVECLIEAVAGNPTGLISESADVLYHLLVMWVDSGVEPGAVWAELERREGVSGIVEKAARPRTLAIRATTRKIP